MASNIEGASSSITGPKMKKLTSNVWKHFAYLPSSDDPRVGEAWCTTCGTKLKAGGKKYGTRHLRDHIDSKKCKAEEQAAEQRVHDLLDEVHSKGLLFPSEHP